MVLNIENIDVAMSSFEQPKLTSKMLNHQSLDLNKKIHFNRTFVVRLSLIKASISIHGSVLLIMQKHCKTPLKTLTVHSNTPIHT